MPATALFPDLEVALAELVAPLVPDGNVNDNTPNDLDQRLPFIRLSGFAGDDDGWSQHVVVDVDVFTASRADGRALAEQIHQLFLSGPHVLTDCVIDWIRTVQTPARAQWDNTDLTRFTGTYRVTTRR